MSIINEKFAALKKRGESALITYIMAGYPTIKSSLEYIQLLSRCGADIIEIGAPFSDPIADGNTIQFASQIALKNGVNLTAILNCILQLKIKKPLIIMTYFNPLLACGIKEFFEIAHNAGISGLIMPDLTIEEMVRLRDYAHKNAIDIIPLIAPTTTDERIKKIGEKADSFVYCVSITGTTGIKKELPAEVPNFVKRVKKIVNKPVVVGFGISRSAQIRSLSKIADGVVIGSRIIEAITKPENLVRLINRFKKATRGKNV